MPLSQKIIERIERGLAEFDDPQSETRRRYEQKMAEMRNQFRPLIEAIERSERNIDMNWRVTV